MPPQFQSVGGAAGNAIQQFLVQREMQNRQRMLAELEQKAQADAVAQQEKDRALREQQLALQQQQEQRIAAAQQATIDDLANQREFGQVERAVEGARPDDAPLDADMVEKVQRQGFGSRLRQIPGVLMQGPIESGDESMRAEEVGITPEQTALRPGSKYLDAEAQRQATAALAQQTEAGRNERAEAEREMRTMIAGLAASGNAQARALDARLKELQIAGLEDKNAAAQKERDDVARAVSAGRAKVRDLAKGLMDDPALDGITGAIEGRRDTFFDGKAVDALSRYNQLVKSLALEERSKLKGQGTITDYEAKALEAAVAAMNRGAGPEIVRKHLKAIFDTFQGDTPNAGGTGGKGFRVVGVR